MAARAAALRPSSGSTSGPLDERLRTWPHTTSACAARPAAEPSTQPRGSPRDPTRAARAAAARLPAGADRPRACAARRLLRPCAALQGLLPDLTLVVRAALKRQPTLTYLQVLISKRAHIRSHSHEASSSGRPTRACPRNPIGSSRTHCSSSVERAASAEAAWRAPAAGACPLPAAARAPPRNEHVRSIRLQRRRCRLHGRGALA